jgi:serine/threonine protein phosphatase PrpC
MKYLYEGLSLKNGRSTNMDSLLLSEREIAGKNSLLAVVCDGVGSMEAGAFAASHAVRLMSEWFSGLSDIERIGLIMRDEVLCLNNSIVELAKKQSLETASTLTALLFAEGKYYAVHIGDTRAYSFGYNDAPTLLTIDAVSDSGKLTGCIGRFENPFLFCAEGNASGKIFLICSDGLYKRADIASIVAETSPKHAKDIKKLINRLAENAIKSGEKDNISLALVMPKLEGVQ